MERTRKSSLPDSDYRRFSPWRRPDWRWQIAQAHIAANSGPRRWEDAAIGHAIRFQRALQRTQTTNTRAALELRGSALFSAHVIYISGGVIRDELEGRLLCQPVDAISEKMGIPPTVIQTYGQIFFDVSDALAAVGWLMSQVIGVQEWSHRPPTERDIWMYLAIAGGPIILDLMIADHLHRRDPVMPDRALLAAQGRHFVLSWAAMLFPDQYDRTQIAEDGWRLFGPALAQKCADGDHVLTSQIRFLRLVDQPRPKEKSVRRTTGSPMRSKAAKNLLRLQEARFRIAKEAFSSGSGERTNL